MNAAGVFGVEPCASETVVAFDAALAVNLRGPVFLTQAFARAKTGITR